MHFDYEKSFIENATGNIEDSFYTALRHQKYNYGEPMHSSANGNGRLFDVIFSYLPRQSEDEIFGKINQVFCQNQIESLQIHMDETAGKIYYSYRNEVFSPSTVTYFHDAVMLTANTALSGADIKAGDYSIISDRELNEINSINDFAICSIVGESLTISGLIWFIASAFFHAFALGLTKVSNTIVGS